MHVPYLNQSRTYLVAVCPVSCCWPKFQSIFNPCSPLQQTTGNNINAKIVLNNKTRRLAKIVRYKRGFVVSKYFSILFAITGVKKIVRYTEDFV